MGEVVDDEFGLKPGGLGFTSARVEQHYRAWRNEQNLPVVRLTAAVSVPPWLATPWLGYLWRSDIDWMAIWWLGYALPVPLLALAGLSTYTRLNTWSTALAALSLTAAGCTMLWIAGVRMQGLEGIDGTGPAVGILAVMMSFGLFMRLPPLAAFAALAPFTFGLLAMVQYRYMQGVLHALYAYAYITIPCVAIFFVSVMAVVQERFMRQAYVSAETVRRQQAKLERSRDLIRRYLPPTVAEQIAAGNEGAVDTPTRQRVTVLFSDIVGFTDMADRVDAESLTQVINEYMATMARIIDTEEGTLNEFAGDGLMALFGAPRSLAPEQQVQCAVNAARKMQASLPALNETWLRLGIGEPLQIRIGINTGVLSVGSFGSEGRMTYTAIGLQTNVAARIQEHCPPGQIWLSDASWHLVKDVVSCEPQGSIEVKGVHYPLKVYSVLPEAVS